MKKGMKIFLFILLIIILGVVGFFIGKNTGEKTNNDNKTNTTNVAVDTTKINENVLEMSVQKALIEVVNDKLYKDVSNKENTTAAEGHKILKSEMKDNKIYAYVVAEYGVYKLENGKPAVVSASASPITLIFDTDTTNGYKMTNYIVPSEAGDAAWLKSLQEMFPADLIDAAKSVNYKDDFYQNQIKTYVDILKSNTTTSTNSKTDTKQILLNVMNNKQKFIDENKKEVYLKDFKIVENQTAKVDKYAFVDLDKDGVEELVIYTTSDYGAYVILHYENEKVYGYMIEVRSLENLKADGSFMGSNGANSTEYLRMKFNKNSYTIETEAVYDGNEKVYKINNANVSEKEIKDYVENWNKKENVSWTK